MSVAVSGHPAVHAIGMSRLPAEDTGLPELLALVQRQPGSTQVLAACLPLAVTQANALHPGDRCLWLDALRAARGAGGLAYPVGCAAALALAERWSDWPLLLALCADLEAMPRRPDGLPAAEASAQVLGLHALGRTDQAIALCRRRMLACPQEAWPASIHAELTAWQAFVRERGPAIEGEGLRLEPLGHQHMADFAWQYHDPAIAALCCLPRFADARAWHAWLDRCWGFGDQRIYAVLHPEWGFVGSVSLIEHVDVGFFYYWLGPDFQGHGIGPRAVRLLLAHARDARGLRCCHAKVFDHNLRSRRALETLGFRALPVRGIPPFDGETFYRLHLDGDGASLSPESVADHAADAAAREARDVEELRWLLDRMDADTRLAVPLVGGPQDRRVHPGRA